MLKHVIVHFGEKHVPKLGRLMNWVFLPKGPKSKKFLNYAESKNVDLRSSHQYVSKVQENKVTPIMWHHFPIKYFDPT